jgi:hypothetical protein
MRKLVLVILTGVAMFCFVCQPALAQTTGTIRGQIRDPDGLPLPGVTVTATSQGRGTSRTVITGKGGFFALPSLDVEVYNVSAVLEGFQEQVVENVRVGISTSVTLDLAMSMGMFEETINVSSSPVLDTTSSSVGTNFEAEFIEDMPTARNFYDMMAVAPPLGGAFPLFFGDCSYGPDIEGGSTTGGGSGNQQAYFGLPRSLICFLAAP